MEAICEFIFPAHCPACGAYTKARGDWCEECMAATCRPHRLPLSQDMLRVLDGVWAFGAYHGGLRNLIRGLKYQRRKSTLPYILSFLDTSAKMLPEVFGPVDIAVPVPLHVRKEKQRGFNQAELIFSDWLIDKDILFWHCLSRVRQTAPQYGLDARHREENMRGAFALAADADVRGKRILLVDDIFTTGSTLGACALVLRKAGAKSVRGLVLASDR